LWRYQRQAIKVMTINVPEMPQARMEFKSLPQSSGEFVLAEAALKSCPERKEGEALLRRVAAEAARYPANDYAQRVLSRAQVDWGNPQDALPYLDAASSQTDAEVLYLRGQAHLRLSQLDAARSNLNRALELDPNSAETAHALFQTGLQSSAEPDEATLLAAIAAWNSAHEVNTFARQAALAYAYVGNTARARNALKLMAHNIREPELSAWAKTWLAKVAAGASKQELLAEMRKQPVAGATFREWTIANARVMEDVERNAGMQDARGHWGEQTINPSSPTPPAPSSLSAR
jgi:tetratricopeptide (TPR) repeat protein